MLAFIGANMAQNQRAHESALRSDLKSAAISEESYATDNDGTYTTDLSLLVGQGMRVTPGDTVSVLDADGQHYCLSATSIHSLETWYMTSEDNLPTTQPCS